jgi:hypothetical protein
MQKLKLFFPPKPGNKGQSFVEMTVFLMVFLFLLVGMVESAYLLNRYVGLVDAAREGARFGSNGGFSGKTKTDPYIRTTTPYTSNPLFFQYIDCIMEGSHGLCPPGTGDTSNGALDAIILDPTKDEIFITFYRIRNHVIDATFGPWPRYNNGVHTPQVTNAIVQASLKTTAADDSGVLVVEIFYAHHQLLKFPIYANSYTDPINVHAYSIMPLSRAKATPTPAPTPTP